MLWVMLGSLGRSDVDIAEFEGSDRPVLVYREDEGERLIGK
jgi:hypothetical protein